MHVVVASVSLTEQLGHVCVVVQRGGLELGPDSDAVLNRQEPGDVFASRAGPEDFEEEALLDAVGLHAGIQMAVAPAGIKDGVGVQECELQVRLHIHLQSCDQSYSASRLAADLADCVALNTKINCWVKY